jgi:hypothetical protein
VWVTMRTATVTWALAGAVAERAPQPVRAANSAARTLAATAARVGRRLVMPFGRCGAGCGSPQAVSSDTFAEKEPGKRRNRSLRG